MKEESRLRDEVLIDDLFTKGLDEAKASENNGRIYAAHHRYDSLALDFEGLRDVSDVEKKAQRYGGPRNIKKL